MAKRCQVIAYNQNNKNALCMAHHGAFKSLLCGMWVVTLTRADFEILI